MRHVFLLAVFAISLLAACTSKHDQPPTNRQDTYLFLGHPYDWLHEDRVDPRLELIDYSQYTGVWIGGDVCARTTKSEQTLRYLDTIFDLKSPQTLWTWGNHDLMEGDASLLEQATGRPAYYATDKDGLLVIVMNTNLFWYHPWAPPVEFCEQKQAHYDWLNGVLDTIQETSQLVMLHHHGLFNEKKVSGGDTLRLGNVDAISVRPLCDSLRFFTAEIYPKLVSLEEAGTAVTLISGDVGMRAKGYHFSTPEGIELLGSGINNSLNMEYPPDYVTNFNPDSVLLVHYQPDQRELSWSFVRLNDLLEPQVPADNIRLQQLISEY